MRAFPLIRTSLSNERVMSALLLVLLLYHIPAWTLNQAGIWDTLILLVFALAVDAAAGFLRHKRPVCAVSGGVTAMLLHLLTPGVPLWAQLIGTAFALLAGKYLWGGTGKNPLNPALTGVLPLALLFSVPFPPFDASLLILPAVLLSLPFLLARPWASLSMMAGMVAALLMRGDPVLQGFLSYGVVLWGCLVITDPVTMTPRPMAGAAIGLLAGFLPLAFGNTLAAMALSVLGANLLSLAVDKLGLGDIQRIRLKFRCPSVSGAGAGAAFHDFTGTQPGARGDSPISVEQILGRVERNKVFGCGGAAFPAIRKIRSVMASEAPAKHLVVNAVECDPGLNHDKWLLANRGDDILRGIDLLGRCIAFKTVTVVVKHDAAPLPPPPVVLRFVPDYYPAGAEKILIRDILRLPMDEDAIPAQAGILVLNVQTVIAICEAVLMDRAADTRYLTIADTNTHTCSVARVRLGDNAHEILHKAHAGASPVFVGGGMMQARLAAQDEIIDETVNFIALGKVPEFRESPQCSRCGLCSAVCPARLAVEDIARHMLDGQPEKALKLHPENCLACGSCSHVCLAGRNLSAVVAEAKQRKKSPLSPAGDIPLDEGDKGSQSSTSPLSRGVSSSHVSVAIDSWALSGV